MDIILSNSSGVPIYEQITTQIKEMILSDELIQGDLLPSMRALARDLKISVITTKRAYDDLERDGFIETVVGRGSFVAAKNNELIREEQLKRVESLISQAINEARKGGITYPELTQILDMQYNDQ